MWANGRENGNLLYYVGFRVYSIIVKQGSPAQDIWIVNPKSSSGALRSLGNARSRFSRK